MNNLNLDEFSGLRLNQSNSIKFTDLPKGEKTFFPEFRGAAYDSAQQILKFSKYFWLPVLGIKDRKLPSISVATADLTGQTQVLKISQKVLAERMHFTPKKFAEVMQNGNLIPSIDDLIQKEEEAIEQWTEKAEGIEETFRDTQERDDFIEQVKGAIIQLVVIASSVNSLRIVHRIGCMSLIKEDSLKFRLIRNLGQIGQGNMGYVRQVWSYFDKTTLVLKTPKRQYEKILENEVVHLRTVNKDQPFGSHILGVQRQCSHLLRFFGMGNTGVGMLMPYYNCDSLASTLEGYNHYRYCIDDGYAAVFKQIDTRSWKQNVGYQLLLGTKYLMDRKVGYTDMDLKNIFVQFSDKDKDLEADLADFGGVFFLEEYSEDVELHYKKNNTNRSETRSLHTLLQQKAFKEAHQLLSAHLTFKLGIVFLQIFSEEALAWRSFAPFKIDTSTDKWTETRSDDLTRRLGGVTEPTMKSLIDKMIAFDWTQRPTLEEVIMEYHQTVCKPFEKLQTKYASNIEALKAPSKDADDKKEKKETE